MLAGAVKAWDKWGSPRVSSEGGRILREGIEDGKGGREQHSLEVVLFPLFQGILTSAFVLVPSRIPSADALRRSPALSSSTQPHKEGEPHKSLSSLLTPPPVPPLRDQLPAPPPPPRSLVGPLSEPDLGKAWRTSPGSPPHLPGKGVLPRGVAGGETFLKTVQLWTVAQRPSESLSSPCPMGMSRRCRRGQRERYNGRRASPHPSGERTVPR